MVYADVIVDCTAKALDRPFQYLVPEELESEVEEGTIIEAPFGNGNRKITGYVMSLSRQAKLDPSRIRPISVATTPATRPMSSEVPMAETSSSQEVNFML